MEKLVIGFIALCVIALPFGIYAAVKDQQRWEQWCYDSGGHVDKDSRTSTGIGYDSKGQPVTTTTTSTTYYCLSDDGRILDIK